jgi:hypothetical protein
MRMLRLMTMAAFLTMMLRPGAAHPDDWPGGIQATGDGSPNAIAVGDGTLFVAGYDAVPGNGEWRLERRALDSGDLDPSFAGSGGAVSNPTFNWDVAAGLATDATHAFVVGSDGAYSSGYYRWRIEKRSLATGALDPAFGTGGVVVVDPSNGAALAAVLAGDLLVAGEGWRVERRRTSDGALVSGFGTGGVIDRGAGSAYAMTVAGGALYVGGSANFDDWRIERRDPTTGALLWNIVETFPDVGCGPQGVFALAADADGIYLAGEASGQWRVERRRLGDGGLVYAKTFPGSGSCDGVHAVGIDATSMYLAGGMGYSSRIEKRALADGALDATFGVDGAVIGPQFDLLEPTSLVLDGPLLYVAGTQFGPIAGTNGRIERRATSDGSLVAGSVSTTTPTTSTTTTTIVAGSCVQASLTNCRVGVRFRGRPAARDRVNVRCTLTLGDGTNGINPFAELARFAVTDADSPTCTEPCFQQTVQPVRRGKCWVYAQPSSASGLRRMKLCDLDAAHGIYRFSARAGRTDLQCLNTPRPYAVDLTIGDDCTTACAGATTTTAATTSSTTTTSGGPTTTLAGGCHDVSAFPSVAVNGAPNTEDWFGPDDARATDDRTAIVRLSDQPSSYLLVSGFGFAVPPTAHIQGISLQVVRAARDDGTIMDAAIRLVKGGSVLATDRSRPGGWTPFYTAVDYGGPSDTWGTTWTPGDINGPGFGAALRTRYDFFSGNNDAGVDSMRITVRYCD